MEELRYNVATTGFRGIQTLTGEMSVDPKYATEAYNIEFDSENVLIPRRGMGRFYDILAAAGCRSSTFWQNDHGAFVVFFGISASSGTLYAIRDLYTASAGIVTLATGLSATHARFATFGNQLLIALVNDDQKGSDSARVLTFDGTNFTIAKAFPAPMTSTFTTAVTYVSGAATVGEHWIGYVPEYTDGHLGKISPDTAASGNLPTAQTFEPIVAEVTSESPDGGGTITVTFTSVTWPLNVRAIHLVMTPVSNSFDFYFVPNGRYTVTGGATSTLAVTITNTDTELFRQESANPYIYLYTCGPDPNVYPFVPHNVAVFGRRACWVTELPAVTSSVSVIMVSEIDNPQAIRLDTGLVKMPDGADIRAAVGIDNSLLIGGTSGIALVQDTQADPVTWPVRYIDESRGVVNLNAFIPDKSSPSGQNESASTKCWVLTQSGIIHTSGTSIPPRTICESFKGWWNRINWKYGNKIQMIDWPERFQLYLLVPLDGATDPTHVFCFNYFLGKSENQINFHLMQVAGFQIGTLTMVHNANPFILKDGRYRDELFLFSSSPGKYVLRAKDEGDYDPIRNRAVDLYTDDVDNPYTEKINALYVTSARPKLPASMNLCGPVTFHVSGKGILKPFGITYPKDKQYRYREIDMSSGSSVASHENGVSHTCTKLFRCTGIRVGLEVANAGDWCLLESLISYHEPVSTIPGSYNG